MLRRLAPIAFALSAVFGAATSSLHAQGKGNGKRYAVSHDKALEITRSVLVRQGFEVVRVMQSEDAQVIYYRRGNRGRGKGRGPVERIVIRTVERRVIFEEAPPAIMVDIDVRLRL
jgi:hypothetical protein